MTTQRFERLFGVEVVVKQVADLWWARIKRTTQLWPDVSARLGATGKDEKAALANLSRIAEKEVKAYVLRRDGLRCVRCGKLTALQVHHVKHRSAGGTWELANLISSCAPCHGTLHGSGSHKNKKRKQ